MYLNGNINVLDDLTALSEFKRNEETIDKDTPFTHCRMSVEDLLNTINGEIFKLFLLHLMGEKQVLYSTLPGKEANSFDDCGHGKGPITTERSYI